MNSLAKNNTFGTASAEVLAAFSPAVQMSGSGMLGVISTGPLPDLARDALEKTAVARGLGGKACLFVDVSELGAPELMRIIESIDPVALVACDLGATARVSEAYRVELPAEGDARALGRTVVSFEHFAAMLDSPEAKQRAWKLLKKLS